MRVLAVWDRQYPSQVPLSEQVRRLELLSWVWEDWAGDYGVIARFDFGMDLDVDAARRGFVGVGLGASLVWRSLRS